MTYYPEYFKLMGCITWTITAILFIKVIYNTAKMHKEEGALSIIKGILCSLSIIIMGSGIGILFFSRAGMLGN